MQLLPAIAPFDSARLKIARARKHHLELVAEIAAYFSRRPIRLVAEKAPNFPAHLDTHAWTVRISEAAPEAIPAIVGDIIHNLRTALDLLACDLVRLNNGSTSGVYFPFSERAEDLQLMIKNKHFNRAGHEAVKMVKELKPYKGGNLSLRAIHDIDIIDKHKILVPVVGTGSSPEVTFMFGRGVNKIPSFQSGISYDGQLLVMYPGGIGLPKTGELPFTFAFVFGSEVSGFAGRDMLKTLQEFLDLTDSIVSSFSKRFSVPSFP
jgi:hypothetical protein